jgi:hypothetical protein
MKRQNVVKLTATGLRTLIREEASRVRRRRGLAEESKYPGQPWLTDDVEEAVETLVGACLDEIYGDNVEEHDAAHSEVHNDIMACVEKIFSEYGPEDEEDAFTDPGVKGDGSYSR